ncbi:MAG: hypothetical protein K9M49_01420 [Candidatus Marinimicrobia bacterium]|nr:hypothetical protein [Candidatus Neomarinimicrobiota bacterium]MCF7903787.1 hypothetical protein [Candidatus Neomarinimicrobiota bacterium]
MRRFFFMLIVVGLMFGLSNGQDCSRCHDDQDLDLLAKPGGIFQKAVGVMDKGQLQNNTGNFGTLSSFHVYFTNALHWPASAAYERQYSFGLGFMVGINENNVIETETQSTSKILDWLPPDDARGNEYSGILVAESDDTPFMASSDLSQSWPESGWPGYFRVDINSLTPEQLNSHPNSILLPDAVDQFTSDRDLFCTYNDAENPQGSHGLTVEQTAYSYDRPYAEDIVFWDLKLFNDGAEDLDSIYIGLYAKFRPDFDNHDYINFIDSDNDGTRDLVYIYDLNNTADGAWSETDDPLGMVGIRVFDTPEKLGVTDFHHFSREVSPSTDQEMWALMTSKMDSEHLVAPEYYFHGNDQRIDYTGADSLESFYPPFSDTGHEADKAPGNGINYIISCGPFDLKVDSMTTLSFGMIMGDAGEEPDNPSTDDLLANVETANEMYELYFQGSGPPTPPTVHAVPGDETVTLYWDASPERARDVWTASEDFEGYKIFRSTDAGLTWGKPITDIFGNLVGYQPIAQFDYTEAEDVARYGYDVSGADPAFPQSLGANTGLVHTYVDSNLVNGVEYWYSVSAYDKGDQSDLNNPTQSYQNAPGQSWHEVHTVRVTPGRKAEDLLYSMDGVLEPAGGVSDGLVRLEFENQDELKDHDYEIGFEYLTATNGDLDMGMILTDLTTGDTLVQDLIIGEAIDTNVVAAHGFLLYLENAATDVSELGWTKVSGDTSTFDWRTKSKHPEKVPTGQAVGSEVETFDDWRITIDHGAGVEARWLDSFFGDYSSETQPLPLKIEVISDPENPVDVSDQTTLAEFNHLIPNTTRTIFYSLLGWDLVPGGLGYLSGSPGWYELHVDMLILESVGPDSLDNYLYLLTNNKPDSSFNRDGQLEIIDAVAPSDGDEFTIITNKPFRPGITYRFNPLAKKTQTKDKAVLKNVYTVPDPYIVANSWETNEFGKRLMFNNIPSQCTIRIYTIVGEHVDTIEHGEDIPGEGYVFWDMRSRNDQFIAPGVYLYHVETPAGEEATGRFLVIK